jgi:hypothetical protein
MAGAAALLQDFRIDAFSIVTNMHAKHAPIVPNLRFDLFRLTMLKRVPQQLPGNSENLVLKEWLQIPPRTFD